MAIRNYEAWQDICLNMDTITVNQPVDTSYTFFGQRYELPVFAGPVGAVKLHYGDKLTDLAYNDILVPGCAQAGIAAFTEMGQTRRSLPGPPRHWTERREGDPHCQALGPGYHFCQAG